MREAVADGQFTNGQSSIFDEMELTSYTDEFIKNVLTHIFKQKNNIIELLKQFLEDI